MQTTITIDDALLAEVQKLSGKEAYGEAIGSALEDYVALRKRLALLEDLFEHKTPHTLNDVKRMRKT